MGEFSWETQFFKPDDFDELSGYESQWNDEKEAYNVIERKILAAHIANSLFEQLIKDAPKVYQCWDGDWFSNKSSGDVKEARLIMVTEIKK